TAFAEFAGRFAESRVGMASLAVTLFFLFCAVFAPLLSPTNPYDLSRLQLIDALKPMGAHQVLPGEESRTSFAVTDGVATPADNVTDLAATTCGDSCLEVWLGATDTKLANLQIRALPNGMTVEGASKHPVQPWWTVDDPKDNRVRIVSDAPFPATFNFSVIAQTAERPPDFVFFAGTDGFGRDMLSAILYGIRISVFVGVLAAGSAMVIGTGLGLLAAWRGGATDAAIMRTVDFMLSFPAILVGLSILAVLGSGVEKVIMAVVLVQWCYYARTSRSLALSELGKEYVEAARCLRLPAWRIMLRHVLPNCMPQIIVLFTLNIAAAIS